MVLTTELATGLIVVTVLSAKLATYTLSDTPLTPQGRLPTAIVCRNAPLPAWLTDRVAALRLLVRTLLPSTAMPLRRPDPPAVCVPAHRRWIE